VSDADVLYMLGHLNNLKRLTFDSKVFTGSAFKQLDSKSLQYLHVPIDGEFHIGDEYFIGGQFPSLKQFYFNGHNYSL
jgi:hypothetical protein